VLIAAGVNAKAITTYMGDASIQTTYDLYGKLIPGIGVGSGGSRRRLPRPSRHIEQARPARLIAKLTCSTYQAPRWVDFKGQGATFTGDNTRGIIPSVL